jgi:heme exporter protein C
MPMNSFSKAVWWKVLCAALLVYTAVAGLLGNVPRLPILNETIRALYFHVPMWFAMVLLFLISCAEAIRYLRTGRPEHEVTSAIFAGTAMAFGVLGLVTGMIWANYTWGSPWHGDPKQNMAAIAMLVYVAYFILRGSVTNPDQRARLSAVYNIFAFCTMIPLLFIIPRLTDSMHPGNGGNPGFNAYDLDSGMRWVFYPAVVGWFLLGVWITTLRWRLKLLEERVTQ